MSYKLQTTGFLMNIKGSSGVTIKKLNTFDWLCDLPEAQSVTDYVEVQFKNTRKGYYLNSNKLPLTKGDIVAVESSPGHDIGMITLTGQLVIKQMKKTRYRFDQEPRRVYRKARPVDMEKYEESKAKEHETMIKSRKIAEDLHLNMKIGDVEYQGDGNKAIFYYIADGRVDFRELIKVLADTFHIRIEMKQIGARQEAGRIGGIGPCGREMCCSAWMTNFVSVSTNAARYQDLSLNPQKLAGQCAKLKCCMNYELDTYVEAQKGFPSKNIVLETKDCDYYQVKTDLLRKEITCSTAKDSFANLVTLPLERVWKIIALNKKGIKADSLSEKEPVAAQNAYGDILGNNDYTRFDKQGKDKNWRKNKDKNFRANDNQQEDRSDNRPDRRQNNRPDGRPGYRNGRPDNRNNNRPNENRQNENHQNGNRPNNYRQNGNRQNGNRPNNYRQNENRQNNPSGNDRPQRNETPGNQGNLPGNDAPRE